MSSKTRESGFSLIELLIVVAIIMVIAAIAVPSYLRSRIVANETSAVSSLKSITTAQVSYASTFPTIGYADTLSKLGQPAIGSPPSLAAAGYLPTVLACATQPCLKSGYNFSIRETTGSPISNYIVVGVPLQLGVTGNRGFCADQNGRITYDPNGGTTCTTPLE